MLPKHGGFWSATYSVHARFVCCGKGFSLTALCHSTITGGRASGYLEPFLPDDASGNHPKSCTFSTDARVLLNILTEWVWLTWVGYAQEKESQLLADLEAIAPQFRTRPSMLGPLFSAVGFGTGAVTALLPQNLQGAVAGEDTTEMVTALSTWVPCIHTTRIE
jgi:hypothetical protein